jgi:alkylmercury lyase
LIQANTIDPQNLEGLLNAFPEEFVKIKPREQQLAITLYRLLALGEAVSHTQLATASSIALTDVEQLLAQWLGVYHDKEGKITGFWGLSLTETAHQLTVNGRRLYAWCAWDTLFLPALLGTSVHIHSFCAHSKQDIRLIIDPKSIISLDPKTLVLSFSTPDKNGFRKDVVSSFCCSVLFFAQQKFAEQWLKKHPKHFIISFEHAYQLAEMINQQKFPTLFPAQKIL